MHRDRHRALRFEHGGVGDGCQRRSADRRRAQRRQARPGRTGAPGARRPHGSTGRRVRPRLREPSVCGRRHRPARRGHRPAGGSAVRRRRRCRVDRPFSRGGAGPPQARRSCAGGARSLDRPGRVGVSRSELRWTPSSPRCQRSRARSRSMVLKPTKAGLLRAAQLVRGGAVVAFPTDTVYGLGASADDEVARKRIYQIKGRPVGMPLILMVAAESQLEGYVHVDSRAESMMRRWWPGPLTLILHAKGGGTLGVRIPKHKVALGLLRHAGPLMTTSANIHGRDPAMNADEAGTLSGVMAVIDGGAAQGGRVSTGVELNGTTPEVMETGSIPTPELLGPPGPRSG